MEEKKEPVQLSEEAFPENFPTSAKPVFRAVGLLVLIIALLCTAVYNCSEHQQNDGKDTKKQQLQDKYDLDGSEEEPQGQ
jgi:hypothetical protein